MEQLILPKKQDIWKKTKNDLGSEQNAICTFSTKGRIDCLWDFRR